MSSVNAAIFDEVHGLVPNVLLPPQARSRIAALAAALPAPIRWTMTEHRLTHDDPRVDFLAATTASSGGHELAKMTEEEAADASLSAYLPFFRKWATPGTLLHRDVEAVWLEYDMLPGSTQTPVPFVPFSVDPSYHRPVRRQPTPAANVRGLTALGLEALFGRPWSPAALSTLERCAAELPALGRVLHVAAAPHRGHHDLRLYVHLPITEVLLWLQRIGWPGHYPTAARALEATGLRAALTGVHIDVGETVRPYFAVERNLHTDGQRPEAHAVMGRLTALGACRPDRGHAAAESVGGVEWAPPGASWPMVVQRDLCIKIIAVGSAIEAKAYLGFRPDVVITRIATGSPASRSRPIDVER